MSSVLVLIGSIVVVLLLRFYFKNKRFYELLNKLPSPPGTPILGHVKVFKKLNGLMESITKYVDEYDGMVLLRPGPSINYLCVADHKLIEILCTSKKVRKSPRYRLFEKWLGVGLFTAEGELWKKHRAMVTPAFHFQILEQFVETFNSVTDLFIGHLGKVLGKDIDIYKYVNSCALDIIAETAMGVPVNAQENSDSEYVQSVHEMLRIIANRSYSAIKIHDWLYRFTEDFHREEAALKILKGHTNSVLETKLKRVANGTARPVDGASDKKKKLAFLDLLLTNRGANISDEEISGSVEGFMFAGHDTGAIGMSCLLYALAKHPDVQQTAFEELRDIYGADVDRHSTYKELQEMKYLEMVIKESLRLYSPAPLISKQLLEDIEYNGYILPKGLTALGMVYSIHRREKYFPNPEAFDPERFSPENQINIKPFSYIPFGAGARNCVGQKFALLEMKIVVSKFLRHYEILPVKGFELQLVPQIVQKPVGGVHVIVKKREY